MGPGETSLSLDSRVGLCLHLLVESLPFFCCLSLFRSDLCGEYLLLLAEVSLSVCSLLKEESLVDVDSLISLPEDGLLVDLLLILFILLGERLLADDPLPSYDALGEELLVFRVLLLFSRSLWEILPVYLLLLLFDPFGKALPLVDSPLLLSSLL